MKKIITLFVLVCSINNCYSQSTLEFNQVIWNTFSGVTGTTFTITVPANKVWKIESAAVSIFPTTGSTPSLSLEDVEIARGAYYSAAGTSPEKSFPIWLPTGSYVLTISFYGNGSAKAFISAIEYNVVP